VHHVDSSFTLVAALVAVTACARVQPDPGMGGPPPGPTPAPATASSAAPSPSVVATPGAEASASPPAAASSAPKGPCPPDMVDVSVACIDRYEAPNEAGAMPLVMQSAPEAEAWCKERGKRLCTEDEWLRACQGPKGLAYPYGSKYQEHHCNQDATKYLAPNWGKLGRWPAPEAAAEVKRLNQSEPSGKRPTCVSAEGVYDLTGNVAEWVARSRPDKDSCQTPEEQAHRFVVKGCFWGKCFRTPHEPACEYVNCTHAAGFHSYEFGVRCCRDRAP